MADIPHERLGGFRDKVHRRLVDLMHEERHRSKISDDLSPRDHARLLLGNILDQLRAEWPQGLNTDHLIKEVLDLSLGFGALEDLLKRSDISEIMINGARQIYVEREGKLQKINSIFRNDAEVMALIEKIVAPLGRRIDESSPLVDARLPDGSRVNAIIPPLALRGPTLTIRKFKAIPFTLQNLLENGTVTRELLIFLKLCVVGRCNLLISGGTGSGKTTFLNFIAGFIPAGDRIITIEDAAELRLPQEHVIALESRPANLEGSGEVAIRTLVRNALRMRPDRIVVGECRGGEALDMLQAMNTGHDGSLTTGHANDTRDMLLRLETMVLMSGVDLPLRAVREQIASAIDLVVQLERTGDGRRRVTRVSEVCGMEGERITLQDIFTLQGPAPGHLLATGLIPHFRERLAQRGCALPVEIFQKRDLTK